MKYFYDTDIEIKENKDSGGYSGKAELYKICDIKADIQPYKAEAVQNEYGLFDGMRSVMYCDNNDEIKTGRYAVTANKKYLIVGAERRKLGMKTYLKEEG